MRDQQTQSTLDSFSMKEKLQRTTAEALAQRKALIKQYKFWYLANNEYPHLDRGDIQMVLRLRDIGKKDNNPKKVARKELGEIMGEYRNYLPITHLKSERSVSRFHLHIVNDNQ